MENAKFHVSQEFGFFSPNAAFFLSLFGYFSPSASGNPVPAVLWWLIRERHRGFIVSTRKLRAIAAMDMDVIDLGDIFHCLGDSDEEIPKC